MAASDAGANDNYGYSVAVADDTLVVGAPHEATHGFALAPHTCSFVWAPRGVSSKS